MYGNWSFFSLKSLKTKIARLAFYWFLRFLGATDIGRSIDGLRSPDARKKPESTVKTSEESNKSSGEEKPIQVKKTKKPREIRLREKSTACQTELIQSASDSERFYQERKELERRIDEEKENHIKCIRNQIDDLNFLLKGYDNHF